MAPSGSPGPARPPTPGLVLAATLGRPYLDGIEPLIRILRGKGMAIEVDSSLSGARVARVLTQIAHRRSFPARIIVDNGPEFTSKALDTWAYSHGVELVFIRPGKPIENCLVESFNGRFRDECLNLHWFTTLADARYKIELWRRDYNQVRPHDSLGGLPPAVFAKEAGLQPATPTSAPLPPPVPVAGMTLQC